MYHKQQLEVKAALGAAVACHDLRSPRNFEINILQLHKQCNACRPLIWFLFDGDKPIWLFLPILHHF